MVILQLSDRNEELVRKVVFDAWQHAASVYLSWIEDEPTLERLGMSYERYCSHRDDLASEAQELADLYQFIRNSNSPNLNLGL